MEEYPQLDCHSDVASAMAIRPLLVMYLEAALVTNIILIKGWSSCDSIAGSFAAPATCNQTWLPHSVRINIHNLLSHTSSR